MLLASEMMRNGYYLILKTGQKNVSTGEKITSWWVLP
jgi:hypothetical protein